jgi:hypothetical protein
MSLLTCIFASVVDFLKRFMCISSRLVWSLLLLKCFQVLEVKQFVLLFAGWAYTLRRRPSVFSVFSTFKRENLLDF